MSMKWRRRRRRRLPRPRRIRSEPMWRLPLARRESRGNQKRPRQRSTAKNMKAASRRPNSSALLFDVRGTDAILMVYRSWAAAKAAKLAGPSNPGSKVVPPSAAPDCLAGLSFVFTGELSAFSREEAIDLAKRFCACVLPYSPRNGAHIILDAWWANHPQKPITSCLVTTLAQASSLR